LAKYSSAVVLITDTCIATVRVERKTIVETLQFLKTDQTHIDPLY